MAVDTVAQLSPLITSLISILVNLSYQLLLLESTASCFPLQNNGNPPAPTCVLEILSISQMIKKNYKFSFFSLLLLMSKKRVEHVIGSIQKSRGVFGDFLGKTHCVATEASQASGLSHKFQK